ncbi:hypothetical protein HPB49_015302 [Dermacentor silvarum]|uniref:Uncharacterized protein n=1 Tax=Dermacentor silvarum TaxID=543639 RepID=A0ACB8D6E8_DERSI|nr:hypothetical protein HPB49_015302 [Dermacentor silvarum]
MNGSSTWFFDGTGCRVWHFPSGQCPSVDGELFANLEQCTTRCLSRVVANTDLVGTETGNSDFTREPTACRVPRPSVCTSQQLRFPAFFQRSVDPGSSPQCLSATLVEDADRRCLAGTNKFRTRNDSPSLCQSLSQPALPIFPPFTSFNAGSGGGCSGKSVRAFVFN